MERAREAGLLERVLGALAGAGGTPAEGAGLVVDYDPFEAMTTDLGAVDPWRARAYLAAGRPAAEVGAQDAAAVLAQLLDAVELAVAGPVSGSGPVSSRSAGAGAAPAADDGAGPQRASELLAELVELVDQLPPDRGALTLDAAWAGRWVWVVRVWGTGVPGDDGDDGALSAPGPSPVEALAAAVDRAAAWVATEG